MTGASFDGLWSVDRDRDQRRVYTGSATYRDERAGLAANNQVPSAQMQQQPAGSYQNR